MINGISGVSSSNQIYSPKDKKTKSEEKTAEQANVIVDIGNDSGKSAGYTKITSKKSNVDEINKLWEQANQATESLKNLVKDILERQGLTFKDALEGKKYIVDKETQDKAIKNISEEGEFGVKAVTERIVAFAKALAGDDKSKIPELRAAIEQGFKEVENIFGELPDISKQTHDSVMSELDKWENKE